MSQDQLMGLLRQILPIVGGILGALGWFTPDAWIGISNVLLQVAGPVLGLAGIVWSLFANSKKSILLSASQMEEVQKVVVTDKALADSVPAPNVTTK